MTERESVLPLLYSESGSTLVHRRLEVDGTYIADGTTGSKNQQKCECMVVLIFIVEIRDTHRFPRENLECLLEMKIKEPSETSVSQYELECAICYT